MFQDRCYERDIDINNNFFADNMTNNLDTDFNNSQQMDLNMNSVNTNSPIVEPMQERVVQRTIVHNVAHVCPIRTKIINNHVYRHTYQPSYSCCEENVVSNVNDCGCGCNLK